MSRDPTTAEAPTAVFTPGPVSRQREENQYSGWTFLRYSFLKPNVLYVELVSDKPFKEKAASASAEAARATLDHALQSTPEVLEDFAVCMSITPLPAE